MHPATKQRGFRHFLRERYIKINDIVTKNVVYKSKLTFIVGIYKLIHQRIFDNCHSRKLEQLCKKVIALDYRNVCLE